MILKTVGHRGIDKYMGKLECICGEILSDTCGEDAYAFTEHELDKIGDDERDPDYRGILECPKCGTLAIEDPIDSCEVKFYKPDNCKFNKLFRT